LDVNVNRVPSHGVLVVAAWHVEERPVVDGEVGVVGADLGC